MYSTQLDDKKMTEKVEHIWTFMLKGLIDGVQILPSAFTSIH
jgi:hypothetical protein